MIQNALTRALECRAYAGKFKQDEAGKVGLGQTEDLETPAMTLELSTGSSLSSPTCPILRLSPTRPWLP